MARPRPLRPPPARPPALRPARAGPAPPPALSPPNGAPAAALQPGSAQWYVLALLGEVDPATYAAVLGDLDACAELLAAATATGG